MSWIITEIVVEASGAEKLSIEVFCLDFDILGSSIVERCCDSSRCCFRRFLFLFHVLVTMLGVAKELKQTSVWFEVIELTCGLYFISSMVLTILFYLKHIKSTLRNNLFPRT